MKIDDIDRAYQLAKGRHDLRSLLVELSDDDDDTSIDIQVRNKYCEASADDFCEFLRGQIFKVEQQLRELGVEL